MHRRPTGKYLEKQTTQDQAKRALRLFAKTLELLRLSHFDSLDLVEFHEMDKHFEIVDITMQSLFFAGYTLFKYTGNIELSRFYFLEFALSYEALLENKNEKNE